MKKNKQSKVLKINKSNFEFLKEIQSRTGYVFHELYYCHNNGYGTCLEIFDYDEYSYVGFLNKFINDNDIVITTDVDPIKELEYDDMFDKMMTNTNEEAHNSKKLSIFKNKTKIIQQFNEFDNHLKQEKLNPKSMTIRLYIKVDTKEELESKVNEVLRELELKKMGGYIQTNDLKSDIQALTSFDNPVKKTVSPSTISDVLMRSEINIVDEGIPLIGLTTNGLYAPDLFAFYNGSYNLKMIGGMGSGKSALIKSLVEGYYIRGDHTIHLLDKHKEYVDFCNTLKIKRVAIDNDNHINLCQINYVYNVEGIIKDEDIASKISVIVAIYKASTNLNSPNAIMQLRVHLNKEYEKYLGKKLSDLANDEWFILSDILTMIELNEKKETYEKVEKHDIYVMRLGLVDLIKTYGFLYNHHTNMEFDLSKSLCFDISFLTDMKDENAINGYVTLLVSYLGQGVKINLEKNNMEMLRRGVKPHQIPRPIYTHQIGIDETMDYAKNTSFLLEIVQLIKFQRKAYSGTIIAIHTANDKNTSIGDDDTQVLLSQLFELCTNTFIGMCDGETLDMLPNLIKNITVSDTQIIANFKKGQYGERQFFANDATNRKIIFTSIVNNFQKGYFSGGA